MEGSRESAPWVPSKPRGKVLQSGVRIIADQFESEPYPGPEKSDKIMSLAQLASMMGQRWNHVIEYVNRINLDSDNLIVLGTQTKPDLPIKIKPVNKVHGPLIHDKKKNFRRNQRR